MNRILIRLSSNKTYYEKLESLKPILESPIPNRSFPAIYSMASYPVLLGGASTLLFPYLNLYPELVPDIALYTLVYSTLHTSMLAGVHVGFGSVLYDPENKDQNASYIKKQIMIPFLAPAFSSMLAFSFWFYPYGHLKSLYSFSGSIAIYIGVLLGDSFYAKKRKTIPGWYFNLNMSSSLIAILGLSLLALAEFMNPGLVKRKSKAFPKSTEEIYQES